MNRALDHGKGVVRVINVRKDGSWGAERSFSTHRTCPGCGRSLDEPDPRLFSYNSKHGWYPTCYGTGVTLSDPQADQLDEEIPANQDPEQEAKSCSACEGARLRPEALAVRFQG